MKEQYKVESERLIDTKNHGENTEEAWSKLKECLIKGADTVCGKRKHTMKHSWITEEIMDNMEERRMWKRNEEKYKRLSKTIKKMCRKPKMTIIMKFAMRLNHWIKHTTQKCSRK